VRTQLTAAADMTVAAGPAGSPRPSAVVVAGLRKSYGAVQAVRGTSFTVEHGEIFALLGPNGAGKTTTLEILEGFRTRDAKAAPDFGNVSGLYLSLVAIEWSLGEERPDVRGHDIGYLGGGDLGGLADDHVIVFLGTGATNGPARAQARRRRAGPGQVRPFQLGPRAGSGW
jgi:energy-coupling factor transporter ATP-binding protein EcfA2